MNSLFCFMGWIISCSLLAFSAENDLRKGNRNIALAKVSIGAIITGVIFMFVLTKIGVN